MPRGPNGFWGTESLKKGRANMGVFVCIAFARNESAHRSAGEPAPKRAQHKQVSAGRV